MKKQDKFKYILNECGIVATFKNNAFYISLIQSIPASVFAFTIKEKAKEVYIYDKYLIIVL